MTLHDEPAPSSGFPLLIALASLSLLAVSCTSSEDDDSSAMDDDATAGDEAALTLAYDFEVTSHRIAGDGAYEGSFYIRHDGGRLDAFVVDPANYALFLDGEPFEAVATETAAASGGADVDLPVGDGWVLVLSNRTTLASTMVGTLQVDATAVDGSALSEGVEPLDLPFRIPPGEHLAVEIAPQ